MIKRALFFFIFIIFPALSLKAETVNHAPFTELLQKYVREGLVNYEGFSQSKDRLDSYLISLEQVSVDQLGEFSREDRIAFWINLYHASLIRMILEEYPVESVAKIPAAFDVRTVRAIGDVFSLTEIRDEVLIKSFRDERILIALNSGRMDSPKLLNEAFEGKKLENQLDQVSREFVEDGVRNEITPGAKKIYLSSLFQKYGNDFILNFSSETEKNNFSPAEKSVISFILEHFQNPDKRLFLYSGRYKIKYMKEDSRLNDVKNLVR